MASARLKLVPPAPEPAPETPAQRVRRLQAEARALAREQLLAFHAGLEDLRLRAEEVADGGDAYPVGARELARRLTDEVDQKAQTLKAILAKA